MYYLNISAHLYYTTITQTFTRTFTIEDLVEKDLPDIRNNFIFYF